MKILPYPLCRLQSSRRRNGISFLLATAMTALLSTNMGLVQADIGCAKPVAGGIYNAGDIMTLDWTSTASGASFSNLQSMTATLVCNDGQTIAKLDITNWTVANNWTVPSVGNATIAGGTTGTCTGNLFHVNYAGTYVTLFPFPWGPVSCGTVTILPSPNNTGATTTTTTTAPTTAMVASTVIKSSAATKGQTTSAAPTPTKNTDKETSSGGPSTTIIVVVAIVAGLILILLAFGTVWYLRRQKRRRMENAIMPWSNQPNNNFAKISSSTDDGPRSFGTAAAVAGAGGAGAYGVGKNKPLPPTGAYYEHDDYGYNDAHPQGSPHGYANYHQGGYEGYDQQQGYEGYQNEDEYYNPYYGQGGATPGSPAHRGPGGAYYNGGSQGDHYGVSSSVSPRIAGATGAGGGYFPPPPLTTTSPGGGGGARSPAAIVDAVAANPSLNSLPLTSSSTMLTSSSSTRRAPQLIIAPTSEGEGVSSPTLASGGVAEAEQDKGIPMQTLPPSSSPR